MKPKILLEEHWKVSVGGLLRLGGDDEVLALGGEGVGDHLALGGHVAADLGREGLEVLEGAIQDVVEGGNAGGEVLGWKETKRYAFGKKLSNFNRETWKTW